MTSKPTKGYTEPHCLTVFVIWAKTKYTWNYIAKKPIGFLTNDAAHYASYCIKRRYKRFGFPLLKTPITCHSINNPCISTQQ